MSNRIDLSQFEGIWDKKHHLSIEKTPTDGCHWTVYFENDVEANMSVSSEFGKEIHEEADRFYHAIDKLPDLLAELKRCYEQLDSQNETISELIESNTVKGEILDELRVCDECGEGWDYHPSGADCEADRQQASE